MNPAVPAGTLSGGVVTSPSQETSLAIVGVVSAAGARAGRQMRIAAAILGITSLLVILALRLS